MKIVIQKEKYGCAVACVATVLGKSYNAIRKDFGNDFSEEGIGCDLIIDYLGDKGCSIMVKSIHCYNQNSFGRKELLKPFAPIHIVQVRQFADTPWTHVVVMDKKGKLYCPNESSEENILKSFVIIQTIGIWK